MTWGTRVARAAVLSTLAVGWAVAGHVWGGPAAHPGGADHVPVLGPALWSLLAVVLLTSHLPAPSSTAPVAGPPPGRLRDGAWVAAALGTGQVLTHVSLSTAPLLGEQLRGTPVAATHHGLLSPGPLTGGPDLAALVAASTHGGAGMMLAHLVATVAAATAWVAAGALRAGVLRWWRRVVVRPPLLGSPHLSPTNLLPTLPRLLDPAFSWDGRGPPVLT